MVTIDPPSRRLLSLSQGRPSSLPFVSLWCDFLFYLVTKSAYFQQILGTQSPIREEKEKNRQIIDGRWTAGRGVTRKRGGAAHRSVEWLLRGREELLRGLARSRKDAKRKGEGDWLPGCAELRSASAGRSHTERGRLGALREGVPTNVDAEVSRSFAVSPTNKPAVERGVSLPAHLVSQSTMEPTTWARGPTSTASRASVLTARSGRASRHGRVRHSS